MKNKMAPIGKEELRLVFLKQGVYASDMEKALEAYLDLTQNVMPQEERLGSLWVLMCFAATMYKLGRMHGKQEERARLRSRMTAAE